MDEDGMGLLVLLVVVIVMMQMLTNILVRCGILMPMEMLIVRDRRLFSVMTLELLIMWKML